MHGYIQQNGISLNWQFGFSLSSLYAFFFSHFDLILFLWHSLVYNFVANNICTLFTMVITFWFMQIIFQKVSTISKLSLLSIVHFVHHCIPCSFPTCLSIKSMWIYWQTPAQLNANLSISLSLSIVIWIVSCACAYSICTVRLWCATPSKFVVIYISVVGVFVTVISICHCKRLQPIVRSIALRSSRFQLIYYSHYE